MSEEGRPGTTGGEPFEAIDPRLNVFALANGMDLSKGPGYRRLEWYTEGLERGLMIEPDSAGFRLTAIAWRSGSQEIAHSAELGDRLSAADLRERLAAAIDTANGLA